MNDAYDNTPALPMVTAHGMGHIEDGLTLRDYFAACAMTGILADTGGDVDDPTAARRAYNLADAMLTERAK